MSRESACTELTLACRETGRWTKDIFDARDGLALQAADQPVVNVVGRRMRRNLKSSGKEPTGGGMGGLML